MFNLHSFDSLLPLRKNAKDQIGKAQSFRNHMLQDPKKKRRCRALNIWLPSYKLNQTITFTYIHIRYYELIDKRTLPELSQINGNKIFTKILLFFSIFDINLAKMGQQYSKEYFLYSNKDWKPIYENQKHPFYGVNPFCDRILFNQQSNQYVEEYAIQFISEEECRAYTAKMQLRKECFEKDQNQIKNSNQESSLNSPYIYRVRDFINTTQSNLCSTIYKGFLYIQKSELRLKEINDIPLEDQLYLLVSTLQGFKNLYEMEGYFDICEEMIFITRQGKVKVWINPNLSKTEPYIIPQILLKTQFQQLNGSQSDMIVKLITIIENNTSNEKSRVVHFKQYLIDKGIFDRLSFYRAIEELDFYCRQNRLYVGDHMNSIYEIHHDIHIEGCQEDKSMIYTEENFRSSLGGSAAFSQTKTHKRQLSNSHQSNASTKSKNVIKYSRFVKDKSEKVKSHFDQLEYEQIFLQQELLVIQQDPTSHKCSKSEQQSQNTHEIENMQNSKKDKLLRKVFTFGEDTQRIRLESSHRIDHAYIPKQSTQQSSIRSKVCTQAIKFCYSNNAHVFPQQNYIACLKTMNTLHSPSQSSYSLKEGDGFSTKAKEPSSAINYYTRSESFTIDSEIAEDLKNIIGFNFEESA